VVSIEDHPGEGIIGAAYLVVNMGWDISAWHWLGSLRSTTVVLDESVPHLSSHTNGKSPKEVSAWVMGQPRGNRVITH
jgi:hypothetical protein